MNDKTRNHVTLTSFIPVGKDKAISMRYLATLLHKNEREARRDVMEARINGDVIIGDASGYYRPATQDELRTYYRSVMSRQRHTAMAVAAVRRKLREQDSHSEYKQMNLFDEEGAT